MSKFRNEPIAVRSRLEAAFFTTCFQFSAGVLVTFVAVCGWTSFFANTDSFNEFILLTTRLLGSHHAWTILSVLALVGLASLVEKRMHENNVSLNWVPRLVVAICEEVPRLVIQIGATLTTFFLVAGIQYLQTGAFLKGMVSASLLFVVIMLCLTVGWGANFLFSGEKSRSS